MRRGHRHVYGTHAAVAGTPTEAAAETVRSEAALLPADLLGGDESIILAIKPSLWFILFDSANWAVGMLFIILCAAWVSALIPSVSEPQLISMALAALGGRVGIALLRWVSRFYVLTNRRVMRVRGVFKADVFECPLVNIRNTAVSVSFHEAFAKLGTVQFVISEYGDRLAAWPDIAHPHEVHAEVRKAIRRALDCQPRI